MPAAAETIRDASAGTSVLTEMANQLMPFQDYSKLIRGVVVALILVAVAAGIYAYWQSTALLRQRTQQPWQTFQSIREENLMDWLLSWYTFWAVIALSVSAVTATWFLGLWPVITATLSTSAGRKAVLIAAGGFLVWVLSIFLYTKESKALRMQSKELSAIEDERNARDQELKTFLLISFVTLTRWVRD